MSKVFGVHVLASGSKGNATIVEVGNTKIMIDAGISCKKLTEGMTQLGINPGDLSAVFITHEHSDHIGGLRVFSKKYGIPTFANQATWRNMKCIDELRRDIIQVLNGPVIIGDIAIDSFDVSHDAANPVGYCLHAYDEKLTYLTDCGYVSRACIDAVEGCNSLILESNHDVNMLRRGSYPAELKRRVLGKYGHLSNEQAGQIVGNLACLPEEIFLAHLSEENNLPSIALRAMKETIDAKQGTTEIYVALQNNYISNRRTNK